MKLAALLELEAAEASDVLTEPRFVGQDISPVVVTPLNLDPAHLHPETNMGSGVVRAMVDCSREG